MLPVDYLAAARRDFDEAFDWYAARSSDAAVGFVNEVNTALARMASDPERFAAVDNQHRQCPVSRYPFRIIYRVSGERVLVVAIAHAKRRPGYWKDRG
jgi:plasmid stabilization system protein ParE